MKRNNIITVGIPALNEEANIKRLLQALLSQKLQRTVLREIIVVDDGSTDRTVQEILSLRSNKIVLLRHTKRLGITASQNDIVSKANADVLVMLDADVVPKDLDFLETIVLPIVENRADMVGGQPVPVKGETFVERVLVASHHFKHSLYEQIGSGDNIYLCHGRARAFAKRFYKHFRWTPYLPEDAYSYLYAKKHSFRFLYEKSAVVYFRCPASLADHAKQSMRFLDSKKVLKKYFSQAMLDHEYAIPTMTAIRKLTSAFVKQPMLIVSFIAINAYTRMLNRNAIDHSIHAVADTSKQFTL